MDLPAGKSKIWRYTSFAKFVRLIQTKSLYFATACQLEDKFEGNLTTPSIECYLDMMTTENPAISRDVAKVARQLTMRAIAVNCWHLSNEESDVMWSRYATKEDGGISIQSTVDRLCKSFPMSESHVWIGKIKYIDYKRHEMENVRDTKQWFLHKRKPFSSERELRAMISHLPSQGTRLESPPFHGTDIPCDISALIQKIYVAPIGPPYMLNLVSDLCRRFGLTAPVSASQLADIPAVP